MKAAAIVAATAASIGLSYYVGTLYADTRGALYANLCLTNRTIVATLEQSLGNVTLADIEDPRVGNERWERYRDQTIDRIYEFQAASGCTVTVRIPPDPVPPSQR